jgi:phosphoribosylaminoimidazole-succinocarboxamide synthase
VAAFPEALRPYAAMLSGRSTLARKLRMLPVECVARGYLAGSGWNEYAEHGTICGIRLPSGLRESEALSEPVFTPATKVETGHDENISFDATVRILGGETAERVRDLTLALYRAACRHASEKGILIADTKFEFGYDGTTLTLGDEILTPDSSRFWPAATYRPGGAQTSLDKQFVRDYVLRLGWDKRPPAPPLPLDIVRELRSRYIDILRRLTGRDLSL